MADFEGILSEDIDLSGRKITVHEWTHPMGVKRGRIIGELTIKYAGVESDEASSVISVYSALAACSTGDVPTVDEYAYKVRGRDIEVWIRVAKRLNPDWFAWMDDLAEELTAAQKKLAVKKKGKRPRK